MSRQSPNENSLDNPLDGASIKTSNNELSQELEDIDDLDETETTSTASERRRERRRIL